jgi:hypothetical protein
MQFTLVGSSLVGYLKDSAGTVLTRLTATDSTYNTGKTGFVIQASGATTVAFDDFKIEKSI